LDLADSIFAIKLYPAGITTNSENGVKTLEKVYPVLEMMSELNIPLSVHGETNGFVLDREREFMDVYKKLATDFPKLKIIMEHIGTADMLGLLDEYENLYGSSFNQKQTKRSGWNIFCSCYFTSTCRIF